jgi:hypothetical protein
MMRQQKCEMEEQVKMQGLQTFHLEQAKEV